MRSRLILTGFVAGVGLLAPSIASPATLTNAEAVLTFSVKKTDACEAFTADFAQAMELMGGRITLTGTVSFKKPAQMRMEFVMPMPGQEQHALCVVGTDKIVWQELVLGGVTNVLRLDLANLPANSPAAAVMKDPFENVDPKKQLLRARERYAHELLPAGELHGQPMYVLRGTLRPDARLAPPEAAVLGALGPTRLYIGQRDGFPHRLEAYDQSDSNVVMATEFSHLKLKIPLDDGLFRYQPAAGANVIDMTQVFLKMTTRQPKPPAPPAGR